ncbi:MAG: M56 family metallopeptidase, partial [Candidatus Zixiibacteriota bacterium]
MTEQLITMIESISEPVAWAIVHSLWQGVGIAGLLAIGLFLLRRRSALVRYALSCGAMLLALVMFVSTAKYMVSTTAPARSSAQQERTLSVATETGARPSVISSVPLAGGPISPGPVVESLKSGLPYLSHIWAVCVILLSLYHLSGWSKARALAHQSTTELDGSWEARFARLCTDLGVTGYVRLAESTLARVPCVVGWLRPVILMPASMLTGLTTAQLEMILAHELAHIRRHDVLINYIQTVIETLMFFNPAVWWISHQIRQERENCCDDFAVRVRGSRLTLAKALTDMEELKMRPSLSVAAGGGSLSKRVRRLVGLPPEARRLPRIGAATLFTLAMVISMALSPVGPWT